MFEINNRLYERSAIPLIKTNVSFLDIPINPNWNNIGINLSGGADSALLTYLICSIIKENELSTKIHIITMIRCWDTRPWQEDISIKVFDALKNMFPDIIVDRHEGFIVPEFEGKGSGNIFKGVGGDVITGNSYNNYFAFRKNLDAIYNAVSMNHDTNVKSRVARRDRSAEQGHISDLMSKNNKYSFYIMTPFRFVKKDWIVAQYHIHNILDLYNITRSCEGDITSQNINQKYSSIHDYNPSDSIPTCGKCFWCNERNWADNNVDFLLKKIKSGDIK